MKGEVVVSKGDIDGGWICYTWPRSGGIMYLY